MITPKQIEEATMSAEKRASAKNDLFAFYIGRPITYVMTIPFLYTNISPNAVTWISFIPVITGLCFMCLGRSTPILFWGWFSFFLWSMFDGIDGNIARYKKQFSKLGDTLDAAAGYFAMAFIPLSAGVAAAHQNNSVIPISGLSSDWFIVLGALSGMFTILPRLIMHKAINSTGEKNIGEVKDRKGYSFSKLVALNLSSTPGAVQLLLLVAVFIPAFDVYTIFYFIVNFMIMILSLRSIFKGGDK